MKERERTGAPKMIILIFLVGSMVVANERVVENAALECD